MEVSQLIITQIYDGVETSKLDELAAEICAAKTTIHPDYGRLASRIIVSNHHKNTSPSYSEVVQLLWDNKDIHGVHTPLVNSALHKMVMDNKEKINATLDYEKDFNYDYFGFKTLERAYLMRINSKIIERPQHMLMRVALGIHKDDLKEALKAYKLMSDGYFTHATPTLFNMGTQREQASSCFLMTIDDDSVDGIFKTMTDCAKISKHAGGIGIAIHKIRAKGSQIRGSNGVSDGIVPMLKCFNEVARYINQCFTPDTMVYTQTGVKRMDEITCKDYLLTNEIGSNKNEFKKVNGISINDVSKEIYEIRGKYSFECVKVTGEHEIYVLQGQRKILNYKVIKNRLDKKILEPKFITVKELKDNDMVGYPIPTYDNDNVNYDEEFCRFYGIMIGDGHIYKKKNNSYEYGLTFGKTNKINTLDFVKNYLTLKNINFWTCIDDNKNTVSIRWSSKLINITYDMLYDNNKTKKIDNSFIHLPANKTLAIIKGLIETDGCIYKEIAFTNTSYQVVITLRYLLLQIGVLSSGHIKNDIGKGHYITRPNGKVDYIENKKISYEIRIPKDKKLRSIIDDTIITLSDKVGYFEYNGIIWSRIRKIKKINYSGPVYDFNMVDNHNYTIASLGLVHNSGRRAGSFAMYLEPHHADIEDFLKMRLNTGIEEERARDLFYSLWTPDLFMRRVEEDGDWTLMCPDKCPGLYLKYGREFEELYTQYEREGRGNKVVKARKIWELFLQAQIETGMPYLGFKDAINEKNNQKNLGVIQSSNLCHEICEFTSKDEIAVCNLASVALPKFVDVDTASKTSIFNYEKLREVVKQVVRNLNKVIDYNYYPVKEAENSNRRHRNIGLGVQGLADVFAMMKMAFDSPEARILNRKIFENIYFAAVEASMELARKRKKFVQEYKRLLKLGTEEDKSRLEELKKVHWIIDEELKLPAQYAGAYSSYVGSPISEGKFQFDMWGVAPSEDMLELWNTLRADIMKHGIRNSLLTASMPTASTSQILGHNECIEPYTNNIYTRKTLAGTFVIVNKFLINDLLELGLWTPAMKDKIIMADGSVQGIQEIPQAIRERYKTVWEMSQKVLVDLSAERSPFICQTQSLNLFVKNPTFKVLNAMHFHSWKSGLKTGCYYLRSQAKTAAQKFSVDLEKVKTDEKEKKQIEGKKEEKIEPKIDAKQEPECLMCSS
jgi:ribonucleoside-diphosphate reductase alpha chain